MSQEPFYPPTLAPWPPWKRLVEEGRLRRVDVVLTHDKANPMRHPMVWLIAWLIRFFTKSYWDHAALVYVIPNPVLGYNNGFVIEAEGNGVDIHNISKYLERPGNDVAIKRLDGDWFTDRGEQPGGGVWYQRQVRGFALDEIDASYDKGRILLIGLLVVANLLLQLIARFAFVLPFYLAWAVTQYICKLGDLEEARSRARELMERGRRPVAQTSHRLRREIHDRFICSGFVQYAYYHAIYHALQRTTPIDVEKLAAICFSPKLDSKLVQADPNPDRWDPILRMTTPAHLGQTGRLRWKYVVKDGCLWETGVAPQTAIERRLSLEQVMEIEQRQVEDIIQGRIKCPQSEDRLGQPSTEGPRRRSGEARHSG